MERVEELVTQHNRCGGKLWALRIENGFSSFKGGEVQLVPVNDCGSQLFSWSLLFQVLGLLLMYCVEFVNGRHFLFATSFTTKFVCMHPQLSPSYVAEGQRIVS